MTCKKTEIAEKIQIKFADKKKCRIFAIRFERNSVLIREHSSVGLEHLPYKQRVGGSTPSAPTISKQSPFQSSGRVIFFYVSMAFIADSRPICDSMELNVKRLNVKFRLF